MTGKEKASIEIVEKRTAVLLEAVADMRRSLDWTLLEIKRLRSIQEFRTEKPEESVWLTRAQAADLLGVCVSTIKSMEQAGKIKAYRIGERTIRYKREELLS